MKRYRKVKKVQRMEKAEWKMAIPLREKLRAWMEKHTVRSIQVYTCDLNEQKPEE